MHIVVQTKGDICATGWVAFIPHGCTGHVKKYSIFLWRQMLWEGYIFAEIDFLRGEVGRISEAYCILFYEKHGGLMVSPLDSGSGGPGSSPGWGQWIVFLAKTLYSHNASLHPGV